MPLPTFFEDFSRSALLCVFFNQTLRIHSDFVIQLSSRFGHSSFAAVGA
jgi:hypothetical protein